MILPIKYSVDWELTHQKNQTQINKYNICKNSKILDHKYKVGDKVMLNNNYGFKHQSLYKFTFEITQCCTNGTVTLKCGAEKSGYNIH